MVLGSVTTEGTELGGGVSHSTQGGEWRIMPRGPDLCTLTTSGQICVRDPSASAGAKALTSHNDNTWKSWRLLCFQSNYRRRVSNKSIRTRGACILRSKATVPLASSVLPSRGNRHDVGCQWLSQAVPGGLSGTRRLLPLLKSKQTSPSPNLLCWSQT